MPTGSTPKKPRSGPLYAVSALSCFILGFITILSEDHSIIQGLVFYSLALLFIALGFKEAVRERE